MKIIIEGLPLAKSRHKCACIGGKPRIYDPQLKKEMAGIRQRILQAWNSAFESEDKQIQLEASKLAQVESYYVAYTFVFPVHKSETKAKRNAKLEHLIHHTSKPDLDNLQKLYNDCATGIIWKDDSNICQLSSIKLFGLEPFTEMEIKPYDWSSLLRWQLKSA